MKQSLLVMRAMSAMQCMLLMFSISTLTTTTTTTTQAFQPTPRPRWNNPSLKVSSTRPEPLVPPPKTTLYPRVATFHNQTVVAPLEPDLLLSPPPPPPLASSLSTSSRSLPLLQLALAGSVTTFFADLSMHPIDCIKTVQQSDLGVHFTLWQAAQYLYQQDGWLGFFHGFLTYASSDAAGGALKFAVWEQWKKKMPSSNLAYTMMGAALAFVASSFLIVPGELLKQQLQMSHYNGLWEAIQGIGYASSSPDGSFSLKGFFAGYDGVLYRDIPYTIMELGLYDLFKRLLGQLRVSKNSQDDNNEEEEESYMDTLICAALTGAIVAVCTTPIDVVKTKLMVDDYASFVDCMTHTVQNHGVGALFSGVMARVAWIVPFTCIYLPTYDNLKDLLQKRHVEHIEKEAAAMTSMDG